jgi:hypothetical protein
LANSTGKAARKRWGTRFAAKASGAGAGGGNRRPRQRRTWGKLTYSVVANNVPEGAVRANEALTGRILEERRRNGWADDANVSVPGPTRAAVEARVRSEEARSPKRRRGEGDDSYFEER